ncbi:MAG: replication initiator protein A [Elusimicrobiota bacterium]
MEKQENVKKMVKEEMNLCEFPFASLTYQKVKKPLFFSDTYKDKDTGRLINRKWVVDGSLIHGIPIASDDDVIMGMFYITKSGGYLERDDKTLNFKIFELLKAIQWPLTKQYYDLFKESLFRLFHCKITSTDSWWDKSQNRLLSIEGFGLIDNFKLYGKKNGDIEHDAHIWDLDFISITWNETIWKSMRDGYIKSTDLTFYASLERPLSKRLFRYADKIFNRGKLLKKPVKVLCCEHLGMSRSYNLGQTKRSLNNALNELVAKDFILPPTYLNFKQYIRDKYYFMNNEYDSQQDKSFKDFIILSPALKKPSAEATNSMPVERAALPDKNPGAELNARGLVIHFLTKFMHKREPGYKEIMQARNLISKYGAAKAKKIVDYALHKVMEAFLEPTEYFGGLLNYEDRALVHIENEERKDSLQRELKEKERVEKEGALAEESERAKFKSIIELLSAEERTKLEGEARQNLISRGIPGMCILPLSIECEATDIIKRKLSQKED